MVKTTTNYYTQKATKLFKYSVETSSQINTRTQFINLMETSKPEEQYTDN